MITITAMKWAPPFAAGSVRDHRARWILNEVGWPYRVRLVDAPTMSSARYRTQQPFGQVPVMEEDGRPALFESGRSCSTSRPVPEGCFPPMRTSGPRR